VEYTRVHSGHAALIPQEAHMADLNILTERQRDIYDFIKDKIENRGYGPAIREICDEFDIVSPNGVMCHLKALEKKGLVTREGKLARAIQVTDRRSPAPDLPILGLLAARAAMDVVA